MPVQPNKFHGQKTETDMDRDSWSECWESGKTYFHKTEKHHFLTKHLEILLNGQHVKVFFPLCGKATDMKWLYDLGHTVVGVEGAKKPVEEFFKENDLEYTATEVSIVNGQLYQTLDKRIRIYFCNIFDFDSSVEGQFGAVWDRGSFGAINKTDRVKYADLLTSLMSPGCRCLLDCFSFDETCYIGPPRNVTEQDIYELYGEKCDIKLIDTYDMLTPERASLHGLDRFDEQLWLLVRK